jgi:3-oxoacyl-[acyl-carrier protein] reductase
MRWSLARGEISARRSFSSWPAADKATVERMRTQAEEMFGDLYMYVSNAARRLYKDFFTITDEEGDYHLNQQLTASWQLARAFVPRMRDRGWGLRAGPVRQRRSKTPFAPFACFTIDA